MKLRWYIKRRFTSSEWCCEKIYNWYDSKPVLQYSEDGVEWLDVETLIEEIGKEIK